MNVAADQWTKIHMSFTPSESGKVCLMLMGQYHGSADSWIYFDNVTVEGASVKNGSFEEGPEPEGWAVPKGDRAGIVVEESRAQDGKNFLQVCHDLCAKQILTVTKGTPVTVTAYARQLPDALPISKIKILPGQRWERTIRRFEIADLNSPVKPGTIVFVGSSSMRMWRTLQKDLAPLQLINRGFGGSTMRDVLQYMDRIVIKYKPRAVVVYEGDNDSVGKNPVEPKEYLARCKQFVQRLHAALPGTPVYFISTKPSIRRWKIYPRVAEYNKLVKAWCDDTEGLTFIDVATPMLGEDGTPRKDIFLNDKLHMNANGYKIWTDTVRPVMLTDFPARGPEGQIAVIPPPRQSTGGMSYGVPPSRSDLVAMQPVTADIRAASGEAPDASPSPRAKRTKSSAIS